MGVWHLSGLGISPGAVTVPLTYVYAMLKYASEGYPEAKEFFEPSGELKQELKGAPECIIIFTSREVISGEKKMRVTDEWYNTHKGKKSGPSIIVTYLKRLINELQLPNFYREGWIKDLYLVEVEYKNFNDCYFKIGVTMKALKDKEVWVNMIAGSNQINISLLLTGGLFAVPSRYYYIFQNKAELLHPENIEKRWLNSHPGKVIEVVKKNWFEIPVFHLEIGGLVEELAKLFEEREIVNEAMVKEILEKEGFSGQYFAKLRGRLIYTVGDAVKKGPLFEIIAEIKKRIERENVNNFSEWKRWCRERAILWRYNFERERVEREE